MNFYPHLISIFVGGVALCGCESVCDNVKFDGVAWDDASRRISLGSRRRLREPERPGIFASFVFPELRRIEEVPARIEISDHAETAFISKRMLWGVTSETIAEVPVRDLVRRQFLHAVSEHFHPLASDQEPAIHIKAEVLGIVLTRHGSTVRSEATLSVEIRDLTKKAANRREAICHRNVYHGVSELPWDGGDLVPDSVYKCIQDVAAAFLEDVAKKHTLIARLEGVSPDATMVVKPSFRLFEVRPKSESGVIKGSCVLACNDWDESRAANWLRSQLERRSENQLGIEVSRVRVVYEMSSYDGEKREWRVEFSAFARSEIVLNYDAASKSGTCIVDFGLMGVSAEKAADVAKDYVMREMDKRAGAQQSGVEGAKARVRFDDFKTDQRYSLSYCAFRVVY